MKKSRIFLAAVSMILAMSMLFGVCAFAADAVTYTLVIDMVNNGTVTYSSTDGKSGAADATVEITSGATVTMTASGENFLYWTDDLGNTYSTEKEISVIMNGDREYQAWFAPTSGSMVVYRNDNTTQQIKANSNYISTSSYSAHLASSMVKYGHTFMGWNKTVSQIQTEITNGTSVIYVNPTYEKTSEVFVVNVNGGTIQQTGLSSGEYGLYDKITLIPNEAPEGQQFLVWLDTDGNPMSDKPVLNVEIIANENYTAVFGEKGTTYPASCSLEFTPDNGKIASRANLFIPSSCTLVEYGLLYIKDADYDMSAMTLANVGVNGLKRVTYTTPAGVLVNTFTNCTSAIARAYIVYEDADGNVQTEYSAAQSTASLNDDYDVDEFPEAFEGDKNDDLHNDTFGSSWNADVKATSTYACRGGATLSTYANQPSSGFHNACDYYLKEGYSLYTAGGEMGDNMIAATYVKGSKLAHIYYVRDSYELNIVTSATEADALPPATPSVTTGGKETTVSQLTAKYGYINADKSNNYNLVSSGNGMGYVVQLADGSFIVYDGGYDDDAQEVYETLKDLHGSESGIVIRAWLITHGHEDHYPAFVQFLTSYSAYSTIERLMVAPVSGSGGSNNLINNVIPAATAKSIDICYVHTGMVFNFCNVEMEILYSPEDIFRNGHPKDTHSFYTNVEQRTNNSGGTTPYNKPTGLLANGYDNETSIVSRITKKGGKSMMFTGDAGKAASDRLLYLYGTEYLKSNMCQVSHHACESFGIDAYKAINADIWFYPCSKSLYNTNYNTRNSAVIKELAKLGTTHIVRTTSETVYADAGNNKAGSVSVTANANNKQNF